MLPTLSTILLSLAMVTTTTNAQADKAAFSAPLETPSALASTDSIVTGTTLPGLASATSAVSGSFTALTSATPGGPINTFSSSVGSVSAETTTTDIQPSEPTGTFTPGSATGGSASASASAASTSAAASEGVAAAAVGSGSKVALVIALGAGVLGWVGL
ncbi:hypothetical protein VMCG_05902 [Cytospora schulzeri]|uniref:Uncharacterized protein n=1 Tax=Cytospora schulzeri TaxID=448051 RepID=A0A423WD81_9PEZI|nr:hypothetical protein VMCG_05902 [Valsa malicola]